MQPSCCPSASAAAGGGVPQICSWGGPPCIHRKGEIKRWGLGYKGVPQLLRTPETTTLFLPASNTHCGLSSPKDRAWLPQLPTSQIPGSRPQSSNLHLTKAPVRELQGSSPITCPITILPQGDQGPGRDRPYPSSHSILVHS